MFNNLLGSLVDVSSGQEFSSLEINELIKKNVRHLKNLGIQPNSRVILLKNNSLDFFIDFLSLWEMDCCVIPLPPKSTSDEISSYLHYTSAEIILKEIGFEITKFYGQNSQVDKINEESLILFSSGTSGIPKGIIHSKRSFISKINTLKKNIPLNQIQNSLCFLPLSFGHGLIGNSLFPFLNGCKLHISPEPTSEILNKLPEILFNYQIHFFSTTPSLWNFLTKIEIKKERSFLRRVHCASSPLNDFLKEKILIWCDQLNIEFYNIYGLTEFASWVSGSIIKDKTDNAGCVGTLWDLDVNIDDNKQIFLKGGSQLVGYIQDNSLKRVASEEWVATGDLGYWDESHRLNLIGRNSLAINRNGIKISPEEIENKILQHSGVKEACVLGKTKGQSGEVPIAIIVLKQDFHFNERPEFLLQKWLSERLIDYKLPYRWLFVENLPYNERGKINRNLLYGLYLNHLEI